VKAKHFEDGGDLNLLVHDDGTKLYICTLCQKTWIEQATPSEQADTALRMTLLNAMQTNWSMVDDLGDYDSIVRSLED
jgi:hypothetical protein